MQMPKDQFLDRLRVLDICDLSDAIDALGMTPAVTGLVLTSGARPIAGRALVVGQKFFNGVIIEQWRGHRSAARLDRDYYAGCYRSTASLPRIFRG